MKYYIIAGEPSGDLYGSKLIDEIFSIDKKAEIRFWGGDNMIKSGGYNVKHIRELAFMGFYEVCLLYTSPSPRDLSTSRMPSSA